MPAPITVDFYFSASSPYAYLASTQMLPLQIETGCRVDWYPVWGRGVISAAGYDFSAAIPTSGALQPAYRRLDTARWANLYKVPFRSDTETAIPDPRLLALAGVAARRFDAGQVFARALMKAIFVDGAPRADTDLCIRIANDTAGIEPHLFQPMMEDGETARILDSTIATAVADGCFGVPSFVVKGPNGAKEMVFGNDRIALLKQVIKEMKASG